MLEVRIDRGCQAAGGDLSDDLLNLVFGEKQPGF